MFVEVFLIIFYILAHIFNNKFKYTRSFNYPLLRENKVIVHKLKCSSVLFYLQENFGAVYCYANGEATRLARDYQFSNGIAVQHNADGSPSLLIVAETASKTLWAYDILGPGKLANRRVWGKLPGRANFDYILIEFYEKMKVEQK